VTTGVLLMTYGAPESDADVPAYLARVRGGRAPTDDLVVEMRRRYALIGGSPLIRITEAQASALETELGDGFAVAAGMRFSRPSIAERVAHLTRRGATEIVGIVLSPQWSTGLMGGYVRALEDAAVASGVGWSAAGPWHRDSAFIALLAERVRDARAKIGARATSDTPVVLTAHSLPRRVFDAEPEYVAQLRETGELVARAATLADSEWHWAYQSAGHTQEEWLRPDLTELFPTLAAQGHRDVLVAPVQFLADHLEVLYDLDVAAADQARAAGLRYHRTRMPNDDPAFIRVLAGLATAGRVTAGSPAR
jgi:ferrochelatase